MTNAKKKPDENTLVVEAKKGEDEATTMSRAMVAPYLRHGVLASDLSKKAFGKLPGTPRFDHYGKEVKERVKKVRDGDMDMATELLTAQALSLDAMMTELMRRSIMNFGDYPLAAERYARLAFKAQSNCRATLETLAKQNQPHVQTVRHVHVNEGGQAVVADNFHAHAGGKKNAKTDKQSHATRAAGKRAALPSQDAQGDGVPISGGKRAKKVPNARRD
jgi:hypothetical protein